MSNDDKNTRHLPERKPSVSKRISEYLKVAGDVAMIVLNLRDKPTRVDWFSAGMRAASVGLDWYRARVTGDAPGAWSYFEESQKWEAFPKEYRKLVLEVAKDPVVAPEFLDSNEKSPYACLAKLGTETVGWGIHNGEPYYGPYYQVDREKETHKALGDLVWKHYGGKHLSFDGVSLVLDRLYDDNVSATEQMDMLLSQVQRYLRAGVPRSYLLLGAPGTGKSVAIRWLTGVLGMRSIRVNVGALNEHTSVVGSLQVIMDVLRPDVLILDDLDRVEVDAEVLSFLELARRLCRLVVASANHESKLAGAALRPGRLDEMIEFTKLDLPVVEKILGEFADLAEEVADLPAAYVAEFADRCKVLGRDEAISGLEMLRKRADETSRDSD